jgi:hypothetical protein
MGNSTSSEVNNIVTNKNINKSLIESINQNTSKIITNTIVSNKTSSQSGTTQIGNVNIGEITASGPGSDISGLEILIEQNAKVEFNADDNSIQNNSVMVDYALKLVEQLQNSISNDQAAKLASEAKSTQKNDWFSTAVANSSKSNANNQITNINDNENITKIFNQITNTIEQNTSTLNFKECIMSNLQTGNFEIGKITAVNGGQITNVKLGIKQSIDVIQNCIFETLQTSEITTKVAQDLGFTIKNDTSNTQKGDSAASASAVQENLGLGDLMSKLLGPSISSIIAVVIIAIIALLVKSSLSKKAIDKNNNDALQTVSRMSFFRKGRK